MAVALNHTIVAAHDKVESARFLADILGLDPPQEFGPFMCVETANGVSLDYDDRSDVTSQHYAFLVSEQDFDAIFERIRERRITYWADPGHQQENVLNAHGRGFYFSDPSGHNMEVLTRAYGT
jgi:extradiol dioxygenase family protein